MGILDYRWPKIVTTTRGSGLPKDHCIESGLRLQTMRNGHVEKN
jgi:hypothetical protein